MNMYYILWLSNKYIYYLLKILFVHVEIKILNSSLLLGYNSARLTYYGELGLSHTSQVRQA